MGVASCAHSGEGAAKPQNTSLGVETLDFFLIKSKKPAQHRSQPTCRSLGFLCWRKQARGPAMPSKYRRPLGMGLRAPADSQGPGTQFLLSLSFSLSAVSQFRTSPQRIASSRSSNGPTWRQRPESAKFWEPGLHTSGEPSFCVLHGCLWKLRVYLCKCVRVPGRSRMCSCFCVYV